MTVFNHEPVCPGSEALPADKVKVSSLKYPDAGCNADNPAILGNNTLSGVNGTAPGCGLA